MGVSNFSLWQSKRYQFIQAFTVRLCFRCVWMYNYDIKINGFTVIVYSVISNFVNPKDSAFPLLVKIKCQLRNVYHNKVFILLHFYYNCAKKL